MAQRYYTLTEAAQFLSMPVEELKQMAQKGQIRSFQDRGTLRFRIQDIQELARKRGISTDPELVLGDASLPAPKSAATPLSGTKKKSASPKTPAKQEAAPDVFAFDFDGDNVDVGAPSSGGKSKPGSKSKKVNTPQIGSDSDVRLVADGSDVTFSVPKEPAPAKPADSDVKISPDPLKPRTGVHSPPFSGGKRASQLALGSGTKPKSKLEPSSASKQPSPRPGSGPQPMDSGVRLVPLDDDSDVKLLGASDDVPLGAPGVASATDSNVRLDKVELPPADSGEGGMMLTEEINLDEEILKQQEKDKDQPSTKLKAKSELKFPTSSPFELSDSDLQMPDELNEGGAKTPTQAKSVPAADSSDFDLAAQQKQEGSSDFDLVPGDDGSILLEGESKDFSLEVADDSEQAVHDDSSTELTSSSSGLTLNNPADEGISLEEGEGQDSSDFDLSLEPEDTPKPQKSRPAEDSDSEFELKTETTPKPSKKKKPVEEPSDSSEFELSLDSDADAPAVSGEQSDDSNFEINLDGSGEGEAAEDSSEFELTLDDSGNLAAADEEAAAPQVKSRKKKKGDEAGEEQDIFDTDFEVPALDESDDATVADSELESSDFDLALDDSDLAAEDESGSQVVALDEEDAETVADEDGDAAVVDDVDVEEESSDFADLDEDVQVEDVDAEDVEVETEGATKTTVKRETIIKEKLIPPAPWGILPVIFMLPCVIIMVLVGILGFEVVQTSVGMKPPGPLTIAISEQIGTPVTLSKK